MIGRLNLAAIKLNFFVGKPEHSSPPCAVQVLEKVNAQIHAEELLRCKAQLSKGAATPQGERLCPQQDVHCSRFTSQGRGV